MSELDVDAIEARADRYANKFARDDVLALVSRVRELERRYKNLRERLALVRGAVLTADELAALRAVVEDPS